VTGTRPATGRQREIRRGAAVARVGEVAAVLREFSVDGVAFTETWDDSGVPPMGCGIVLAPWPNRVADGQWTYQGALQKLDITDLSNGHAIHGLLRNTAYQPVAVDDGSVTLAASIYPQHGYPFTLDTQVSYALSDEGLSVTHQLTNVGAQAAPFGVGAHPYLRVGERPVGELVITVSGSEYARTNERLIPVAVEPVDGTPLDLRSGVQLDRLDADVAVTGFAAAAGIGLINSLGNLGGFLAPNMRDFFDEHIGGNAGLNSLAVGAVLGAILFGLSAFFKKANEIEAGHLDKVDAQGVRTG